MKPKSICKVVLFTIIALFSASVFANAGTFYIRAGATGANDGSDWTNAYQSFSAAGLNNSSSSAPRGNTYYIASGEYGYVLIKNNTVGTDYIIIKKAIITDHGTDTGWDGAYAGQATFLGGSAINTEYVIWDGAKGYGDDPNHYGFKCSSTGPVDTRLFGIPALGFNIAVNYVAVSHTAFVCWGSDGDTVQVGIYSNPYTYGASHVTISHNYFSGGAANMAIRNWKNCVIENNYFDGNWSSAKHHGEQISPGANCDDIILRNNIFKDSLAYVIGVHKANNKRWKVYNNIVTGGSVTALWGSADSSTSDVMISWEVYNNTHVNVSIGGYGAVFPGTLTNPDQDHSYVYNNLFFGCNNPSLNNGDETPGAIIHQYNAFYDCAGTISEEDTREVRSGNPFLNSAGFDYHLASPTQNGKTLSSPFNLDLDGVTRGTDGIWDKGAFEYAVGGGGVLGAPQNLRISE